MTQSSIKKFLNTKITIYRAVNETDDYGGVTSVWTKLYWDKSVRIYQQTPGRYSVEIEGKTVFITDKLICNVDIDIRNGDKIVDEHLDNTYKVIAIHCIQQKKKIHHIECWVVLVETE